MRVAAVRTTGIYCKPSCNASPNPSNVSRFPLPAAAEAAGYRACLRCRPYREPQAVSWDAPDLVCRAVRIVLRGALDEANEDALARRLGISARHLRRLFAEHLGVTPDFLARSARAHFARRLLDDTDLSVTEIAFASGFGSLRQFNRVCKDIFRASPTELRAKRRRSDRLVADGGLPLRLRHGGRRDWHFVLSQLAERAIPGVESVEGAIYRRTIPVQGHVGVIELTCGGDDHLRLTAHLPRWEGLIHIVERARAIANLDFPLEDANAALADDDHIGALVHENPGIAPPGCWDPFEVAVFAVLEAHDGLQRAREAAAAIAELGEPLDGVEEWQLFRAFPSPAVVAEAALDGVGVSPLALGAVKRLSTSITSEEIVLDGSLAPEELTRRLALLPGVGARVASYVAYRLGDRDAWPTLALGTSPETRYEPSAPFGDWRAVAAAHVIAAAQLARASNAKGEQSPPLSPRRVQAA